MKRRRSRVTGFAAASPGGYRGKGRTSRTWRFWLLLGCGLLLLTGGLLLLCRTGAGHAMRWVGVRVDAALCWLFSWSRWPVTEGLLLLALPLLLYVLIRAARRGRRWLGLCFSRLFCLLCAMVLFFAGCFGVQYAGTSLADELELEVQGYTRAQLVDTLSILTDELNRLAPEVPRDETGGCAFGAFDPISRLVMEAYDRLDDTVPALTAVSHVPPKQARLLSLPMSYCGLAGFFCPWTGECVVSGDTLDVQVAYHIAHEAAHARGVGSESEANFAAFLACTASDDVRLAYSGVYCAWVSVYNAYWRLDAEAAWTVREGLCQEAKTDLDQVNAHLRRYDTFINTVGTSVNDVYIKVTGQPDGIQSYGRVADLLIAYYHA